MTLFILNSKLVWKVLLGRKCHEGVPACLGRNRMNSGGDHHPSTRDMTLALEIRKTGLSYN